MANTLRRPVTLPAGVPYQYTPDRMTNVLLLINQSAETIYVSTTSNPVERYEALVGPRPSTTPFMLDAAGSSFYLYAADKAQLLIVELSTDEVGVQINLSSIMVDSSSTVTTDITDSAARELGKVSVKGTTAVDMLDKAGRQLGQVSITGTPAVDVTDDPTRQLGQVSAAPIGAAKVTAAGAGLESVKAGGGLVYSAVATVNVELQDGSGGIYFLPANVPVVFSAPLTCTGSIKADFSGPGSLYIQYS